jgi:hypothetical protein
MERLTDNHLIEIAIAVFGGIVLGWLVKKLLFPVLYKLSRKTKWKSDDLIIESIGKWVIFWFFLGACLYITPIFIDNFSFAKNNALLIKRIIASLYIFSVSLVAARIAAGMLQIRSEKDDSILPPTRGLLAVLLNSNILMPETRIRW